MKINIKAFALTCGLSWAFVDGIIGGAIFAWLYNALSMRFQTS